METVALDQTLLFIIIGAAALVVGILIGKALGGSDSAAQQTLEDELESTKAELEKYKVQVTEHFSKTAELVNNMTESYKDVYRHLAESAEQLGANEQFKIRLESDNSGTSAIAAETVEEVTEEKTSEETVSEKAMEDTANTSDDTAENLAPKDYAPKEDPDAAGTLSEEFGLKEESNETSKEAATEKPETTKS